MSIHSWYCVVQKANTVALCSGYGTAGSEVASNTRDPRFDTGHRQMAIYVIGIENTWDC